VRIRGRGLSSPGVAPERIPPRVWTGDLWRVKGIWMASLTEFPWRTMAPKVRQYVGERLSDTPPLLRKRLSVLTAVGIGVGCFALPFVLWWLTSAPRASAPTTTPGGIELQQMLSALHTVLADPTLGSLTAGTASPFTLKDVDVEVRFVVQKSASTNGTPLYRLVPVDTALQTRPEHVQTLKVRLISTPLPPATLGSPGAATPLPRASEESDVLKSSLPKKRARP